MKDRLTDEEIIEILERTYRIHIEDKEIKKIFLNCLSNDKYTTVGSLNTIETDVLRQLYGINQERTEKDENTIMKNLGISEEDLLDIFYSITEKTANQSYDINKLDISDDAKEFCLANNIDLTINSQKCSVNIPKNLDIDNNLNIICEIKNAVFKYSQLSMNEKIFKDIIYNKDIVSWISDKNDRILIANCLLNETYKKVNDLSLYDTQLLRERFGINLERKPKKYTELGKTFKTSATTIKQHVKKAIRKSEKFLGRSIVHKLHLSEKAAEFYFGNNITLKWGQSGYDLVVPQNVEIDNNMYIMNEIQQAVLEYSRKVAFDKIGELQEKLNQKRENLIPIEELDLSVRAYHCLKRGGINTVSELLKLDIYGWHRIRNAGNKSMEEIVEKIHSLGLMMHETVEKEYQEIINSEKKQSNTDNVEVIDFEEKTEHMVDENDETKKRIDEKEKLLTRYKEVSQEKESLLKKEAALDAELQEIMQKIQNSNMEKKDERTKR